jgi:type III secretory pathway component EscV
MLCTARVNRYESRTNNRVKLEDMKSKYDKFETIQERIDRLQDYYDDPNNGLNKCFIVQKIKELKQRQLQEELEKRNFFRILDVI